MNSVFATIIFVLAMTCRLATGQEQFNPHLRFAKGDAQHFKVTLTQKIDQLAKEVVQHINQTMVIGYTINVDDVDADGTATITVHFESVNFTASTPAGHIDYDSASPAAPVPPMASGLAALIGQSYSARISADGIVKQVGGVKGLLDAVLARLSASEGVIRVASEKTLREQLGEQNLMQNLQNLFSPLPGRPVSVGDTWDRTANVRLGMPLTVRSTYTLLSRTAGAATVEVTGSVVTTHDSEMDLGPMKLSYDLKGDQNGTLQIVESTGQTTTAEIFQHLSGSATLQGPNTDPITVFVTNYSTIKVERK